MKTLLVTLVIGLLVLSLAGCAPGPNPAVGKSDEDGEMAGFWDGLWHGFIAPVTFVISLFSSDVNIYEVYNNGGWYDLGFMLGLTASVGGSGGGSATAYRRRRRRNRHRD